MSTYTEDSLVQQTTAAHLEQQLDWQSVYAYNNANFASDSVMEADTARGLHE